MGPNLTPAEGFILGVGAKIVGRVEECDHKELIIRSEFGEFVY